MNYGAEPSFDNIENAERFVELLIEGVEESRRDVDADIALNEFRWILKYEK